MYWGRYPGPFHVLPQSIPADDFAPPDPGRAAPRNPPVIGIVATGASTGATQLILFGSIFTVEPSTLPEVAILSCVVLLTIAFIARPLLLSSVSTELAAARGVRVRVVGLLFMVTLAVSVGLSAIVIGSILSTALLIGPPASALKVVNRFWFGAAIAVLCLICGVSTLFTAALALLGRRPD